MNEAGGTGQSSTRRTTAKNWGNLGLIRRELTGLCMLSLSMFHTRAAGGAGSACIHLGALAAVAATTYLFGYSCNISSGSMRSGASSQGQSLDCSTTASDCHRTGLWQQHRRSYSIQECAAPSTS